RRQNLDCQVWSGPQIKVRGEPVAGNIDQIRDVGSLATGWPEDTTKLGEGAAKPGSGEKRIERNGEERLDRRVMAIGHRLLKRLPTCILAERLGLFEAKERLQGQLRSSRHRGHISAGLYRVYHVAHAGLSPLLLSGARHAVCLPFGYPHLRLART